ncbi:amidohydrolase family protein [Fodinibius halophilus]|uniref:Amidohydrolase family protein n=1 Tax=Fodinibius halophilus TaxID=1736908 RepID=A0A6M1SVG2_9BACT|nr:amidohydrolase family protein [Fodinibius halophilus]NGP87918.1 amidohydrolase family protein [Fodinibius halophilus]
MKSVRTTVLCILLLMVCSLQGWSQSSPAEAFKNVTIHTADGETIKSGTIVWRNGVITSLGKNANIPFDAYVRDGGDSLHVYPGFIDGLALWGSPDIENDSKKPDEPGNPSYARAGIQPDRVPADQLKFDDKVLEEAPKHGFTTAAIGLKGRMLAGQVDLFSIDGENTKDNVLENGIGILAQFEEAGGTAYPSTTMGVMTTFRQLFNDAKALRQQQRYYASTSGNYSAPEKDKVLETLYPVMDQDQPFYFVVDSKENIERLFWLQDELGFEVVIVSGKEAYKKADELKKRNISVLASIDLPEKPEWKKAEEKKEESEPREELEEVTEEMRVFRERQLTAYKADIQNIRKLLDAGVKVGYASNGFKLADIQDNITTLKEEGNLSEEEILEMLSQTTAEILGYGQKMGDVATGNMASFTVFSKPFSEEKAKALYSVTDGELTEFESKSSN